jgi:hypothetical protein
MLDRIAAQAIAEAQKKNPKFTLTDAGQIIADKAALAKGYGAPVDVMVLAAAVTTLLKLPSAQSVTVVKEAMRLSVS